jgi:Leucine-rich repeat (LRR) protein
MHDLYHELAEYVSAKEYSRIEKSTFSNVEENARHLSLAPNEDDSNEIIQFYALQNEYMKESQIPGLRTLLVLQKDDLKDEGNTLYIKIPSCMFKFLGSLRALDLSNTNMELLPHSVGELIHLRYLSLENTKIKCLPESISALFKLHSMNLKCCNNLSELPKGIKFLTNLRHLELPSMDDGNMCMPCGIGELTNLQTIHVIRVGSDPGSCGIADLVNLNKLRGELCVSGIENVTSAQITPEASIKNKGELRKLILHWSCIDSVFSDDSSSVLDSLQPHPDLEELIIRGFPGVRFPLWMGNQYMFSLSILELKDCRMCKELPSLGQLPCLKHLSINSFTSIKHVRRMLSGHDETNCGDYRSSTSRAFPTLETLKFMDMDSWELWDEVEATDFPCLQHLTIMRCSKLSGLPNLQALQNLRIKTCENLLELPSFPSLQSIKIEGFWSVSQVLQLPIFSHIETLELHCHKKLVSVKKIQNPLLHSLSLKQKGPLHKVSGCELMPFQNMCVKDGQVHMITKLHTKIIVI